MSDDPKTEPTHSEQEHRSEAPRWRKGLVFALLILVLGSVLARVALKGDEGPAPTEARSGKLTTSLGGGDGNERNFTGLPGGNGGSQDPFGRTGPTTPEEAPTGIRALLPYLTEGGIAMLLGIALGIATRSIFRIAILLMAVVFIAIQFLAYKGILTVDWGAFGAGLKQFVLNVSSDNGLGAIVQHKLPSAGSLAIGYWIGLRRG